MYWTRQKSHFPHHQTTRSENDVIECEGTLKKTATSSKLKDNAVLSAALNDNASVKGAQSIASALGIDVTESTIKHLRHSRALSPADIINSFNNIEPFLDAYMKLNPGAVCKVDRVGEGNQLGRILFIPHYTKSVLSYIYDIIGKVVLHTLSIHITYIDLSYCIHA